MSEFELLDLLKDLDLLMPAVIGVTTRRQPSIAASFDRVHGAGLLRRCPMDIPRLAHVQVDGIGLAFAFVVSLLTGGSFGVFPAWSASRSDSSGLWRAGRGISGGRGEHRLRGMLVTAETAISLVLLAGSGLLIRSFVETMRVPPGFDPHHVLTFVPNDWTTTRLLCFMLKRTLLWASAGQLKFSIDHDLPTNNSFWASRSANFQAAESSTSDPDRRGVSGQLRANWIYCGLVQLPRTRILTCIVGGLSAIASGLAITRGRSPKERPPL
jgi:hypothetical protein